GTHGSLSLPNLTLWSQDNGPDWWAPIHSSAVPVTPGDSLVAQIAHFAQVIQGQATPLVTARDGLRAVQVIEAIKTAAHTGQVVDVS
ncbi:MAG: Gfo/Idh/MocA family oxidoreductase, partial [Pseudomonadota bacterium]